MFTNYDNITEMINIIDMNTNFTISFEIKITENQQDIIPIFWRYVESIQKLFVETENDCNYQITEIKENKDFIRITGN